ncbi:hypothetical protein [Clostridium perfringens]|uniref:hypothetical protein n=1 Tax=Clostridium perfringens TaxID=1502 RepID=UPI003F428EBF
MENVKKDEWLHEEFGIKVDNRYLCIRKNEDRVIGQILNFSPRSNIAIKCEDGLHIIPYKEILELRPLPKEKVLSLYEEDFFKERVMKILEYKELEFKKKHEALIKNIIEY